MSIHSSPNLADLITDPLVDLRYFGFLMLMFTAISVNAEDVKQEIIDRCRANMGSYGSAMVKACVDQDIAAIQNINKIHKKYNNLLARCMRDMREYGFSMVYACAKQDIEAEEALSRY